MRRGDSNVYSNKLLEHIRSRSRNAPHCHSPPSWEHQPRDFFVRRPSGKGAQESALAKIPRKFDNINRSEEKGDQENGESPERYQQLAREGALEDVRAAHEQRQPDQSGDKSRTIRRNDMFHAA
jgi:hypothetical protein